jgi:hypothetical protein
MESIRQCKSIFVHTTMSGPSALGRPRCSLLDSHGRCMNCRAFDDDACPAVSMRVRLGEALQWRRANPLSRLPQSIPRNQVGNHILQNFMRYKALFTVLDWDQGLAKTISLLSQGGHWRNVRLDEPFTLLSPHRNRKKNNKNKL